jgi:ParB family chromosome partitioning protein
MNRRSVLKSLDVSLIDFNDFSYALSPGRWISPENSLTESIAENGIIHPPAVKKTTGGSYVIVSGRKRLQVFRSLFPEEQSCFCIIFSETTPEIDIYSYLLEEIIIRRQLTPVEKGIFLQKISSVIDEKRITEKFLSRLGLPRDPIQIKRGQKLLDLDAPLVKALHQGNLHESVAQEMLALSSDDRLAIYEVISTLKLGVNYQKKLMRICQELAGREQKSIGSLLKEDDVQETLNHREANPPQKAKNLMSQLMRKYKPRSSRAEDEFNHFVSSLRLPKNISVTHTQSFEDDLLTLAVTASDKKFLLKILGKIKDAT